MGDEEPQTADGRHWCYAVLDGEGNEQARHGPFASPAMRRWHEEGYLRSVLVAECVADEPRRLGRDVSAVPPLPHTVPEGFFEGFFYQSPDGEMHGPYMREQMEEWHAAGYFTDTLVARCAFGKFAPLDAVPPWDLEAGGGADDGQRTCEKRDDRQAGGGADDGQRTCEKRDDRQECRTSSRREPAVAAVAAEAAAVAAVAAAETNDEQRAEGAGLADALTSGLAGLNLGSDAWVGAEQSGPAVQCAASFPYYLVLDTCVLLDEPEHQAIGMSTEAPDFVSHSLAVIQSALESKLFLAAEKLRCWGCTLVLPRIVLHEIDQLRKSEDPELNRTARAAMHYCG